MPGSPKSDRDSETYLSNCCSDTACSGSANLGDACNTADALAGCLSAFLPSSGSPKYLSNCCFDTACSRSANLGDACNTADALACLSCLSARLAWISASFFAWNAACLDLNAAHSFSCCCSCLYVAAAIPLTISSPTNSLSYTLCPLTSCTFGYDIRSNTSFLSCVCLNLSLYSSSPMRPFATPILSSLR